ncbi:hypothetical protein GCM10018963_63480 [Saccharothrix longispora]
MGVERQLRGAHGASGRTIAAPQNWQVERPGTVLLMCCPSGENGQVPLAEGTVSVAGGGVAVMLGVLHAMPGTEQVMPVDPTDTPAPNGSGGPSAHRRSDRRVTRRGSWSS